jgi:hypothetical protein
MGSPITVYRPNSNVIRLGGGSRTSVAGSPGGGGSGGVGDIFKFFKDISQDRDNREILRQSGHDEDIINMMSRESLQTSADESVKSSIEGDAIKQLSQNFAQGNSANRDFVGYEEMQDAVAKGLPVTEGVSQRQPLPFQFQGESKQTPGIAALGRMFLEDGNINEAGDLVSQTRQDFVNKQTPNNIPGSAPVQEVTIGDPTARYKGQSELFQEGVRALTDAQAGRADNSNIISKLQGKAIKDDDALFDRQTKIAVARNKESLRPTTYLDFDKNGNPVSKRGVHDLGNGTVTPSTMAGIDKKDVLTPPSVEVTKTENNENPGLSALIKDTSIDTKDIYDLNGLYQQAANLMDDDFFGIFGELETGFFKYVDKNGIVDISQPNAERMQKAVNFVKLTRQIFLQEKIAVTGLAAPVQEAESLEDTFLNFEKMGAVQLRGFLVGNMARLEERANHNIDLLDDYENMKKNKNISLPTLLRNRGKRQAAIRKGSGFEGTSSGQTNSKDKAITQNNNDIDALIAEEQ